MSRIFTIEYVETTFTFQGEKNETEVNITTRDVSRVLSTLKVACSGPSRKDKIIITIEEVM